LTTLELYELSSFVRKHLKEFRGIKVDTLPYLNPFGDEDNTDLCEIWIDYFETGLDDMDFEIYEFIHILGELGWDVSEFDHWYK
jgi:hypothetical protein